MYGYIYMTTNNITGLIYIGQKHSDIFLGTRYLGSGKKLLLAIDKYGREAFSIHLIERVDSEELMDEREIYWIAKYNSTDSHIGYNISTGGNVNRRMIGANNPYYGRHHSEEVRKKMREHHANLSGKNNPNFGKHLSEEAKQRLSKANTGRIKTEAEKQKRLDTIEQHGGYGFWITDEYCKKLSESLRGKNIHSKGRIWVNNGSECKMVEPKDLDIYLNSGWKLGRLPISEATRQAYKQRKKPKPNTGYVWITNDVESHTIRPEELDTYIAQGYHRGRTLVKEIK